MSHPPQLPKIVNNEDGLWLMLPLHHDGESNADSRLTSFYIGDEGNTERLPPLFCVSFPLDVTNKHLENIALAALQTLKNGLVAAREQRWEEQKQRRMSE